MNKLDLQKYAREVIKKYPQFKIQITDILQDTFSEINSGGGEEHECYLAYEDIKEMISENRSSNLKSVIRELVRKELKEMTGTAAVPGYLTPNAFGSTNKKSAESLGMKMISKEQEEDETTVKEDVVQEMSTIQDQWNVISKFGREKVLKNLGIKNIGNLINLKFDELPMDVQLKLTAKFNKVKESALPIVKRGLARLTEGKIVEYEDMTPRQKIYQLSREARRSVNEIELLLDKMLAIKQEEGVNSDDYYKRTHTALQKMNEKIKHCILKMNSMK
ncbi:MAG: hypothetical protein WC306_03580 [Candidatus Paceibacterota bacterium]|jgi:hypothetical protein